MFDDFIVEKCDAATTWAQRRGYNLEAIKVWHSFATLLGVGLQSLLLISRFPESRGLYAAVSAVSIAMFSFLVWMRVKEYGRYKDYPENARMTQALNAVAVHVRYEKYAFRIGVTGFMLGMSTTELLTMFLPPVNVVVNITNVYCWVMIVLYYYLDCCTYLGPGEHSRVANEVQDATAATETHT